MSTQSVTIQGHLFTMSAPYKVGHVLTAGEAQALNQLRAENVRNNFAARMKAAAEKGQSLGQSELTAYDESYAFQVGAGGGPRGPADPVTDLARRLALHDVKGAIRAGGLKVKDFSSEKLESLIDDALAQRPEYMKAAAKAIAAQKIAPSAPALNLNLKA